MSEDLKQVETTEPKRGRPKGSKNRPKRGRPKGSGKPKKRGRPLGKKDKKKRLNEFERAKEKYNLPTIKQYEEKEELVVLSNLEASVVNEKEVKSLKTENQTIDRYLDDEKLLDVGYNTHTDKIINQEPIDPSFYYRGSKNVPVAGAQYEFTSDMVDELRKCKEDIIYFAENFFYIVNLDRGKEKIKLYDAQKNALTTLVENRFVSVLSCRQAGKCFSSNTLLQIRCKSTGEIKNITAQELFNGILT